MKEPQAPSSQPSPPFPGKLILVVDDDPEVAALLAEMLSADGHAVETAANGVLALEKLRERAYDLIVSDIVMPELDGPGLYREAVRRDPRLRRRFIFITGSLQDPKTREFLAQTNAPSLSKPFSSDEIRRVVQHAFLAG